MINIKDILKKNNYLEIFYNTLLSESKLFNQDIKKYKNHEFFIKEDYSNAKPKMFKSSILERIIVQHGIDHKNIYNEHIIDYFNQRHSWFFKHQIKAGLVIGVLEEETKNTLIKMFNFNENINAVDVGCRVGSYSRLLTNYFSHVYSFEPMLKWKESFEKNVLKDNKTHFQVALHNKNKTEYNMRYKTDFIYKTLDTYCLKNINFIKIDTDGNLLNILKGANETISNFKPLISIEIDDKYADNQEKNNVLHLLQSHGYSNFNILDGHNFIFEHIR